MYYFRAVCYKIRLQIPYMHREACCSPSLVGKWQQQYLREGKCMRGVRFTAVTAKTMVPFSSLIQELKNWRLLQAAIHLCVRLVFSFKNKNKLRFGWL